MQIIVSGLSHKTAPVEVREALAFPSHELGGHLNQLLSKNHISESVILSTCNRTEIYAVASDIDGGKKDLTDFLKDCCKVDCDLSEHLYFHDSVSAIHHLFRVTSSLDSMIIGEGQILGQVKEAYSHAFENDATNAVLNKLFRKSFAVGKRVRTDTDIGENAVSVSYSAVQLAKKVFEDLSGKTVMIIGAGKMSELTTKHLQSNGVENVLIANRSFNRAVELAKKIHGTPIQYDRMLDEMVRADIVITSTGSPDFILNKKDMKQVLNKRRRQPIFLIDIAVPRDIDPKVNDIGSAYLYNIDDLKSVVDSNLAERTREAKEAEKIISFEVTEFLSWLSTLEVVPTIAELRQIAERIRRTEIEKAQNKLGDLSEAELNAVNALTNGIINKLLHKPMVKAKESTKSKNGYIYVESLRHLFGLDDEVEEELTEEATSKIKVKKHKHVGAS